MPGTFYPFLLPFSEQGKSISAEEQARRIIAEAAQRIGVNTPGFGITYSANYNQTQTIREVYAHGIWRTGISGANQAQVMTCIETLQETEFQSFQNKIRIVPITTMTYSDFGGWTHRQVVEQDLEAIHELLNAGWIIAAWVNQVSDPDFAIGGGIARLPNDLSDLIQQTLRKFCAEFPTQ
jgi:hypothetical protein